MKAKTKLQKRISELSASLPQITPVQKRWATHHCLSHIGFATVHRVLCLDCGQRFPTTLVKENSARCPLCKNKLTIKKSACRSAVDWAYFAIATVKEEFQVIRYFRLLGKFRDGYKAETYCYPILEYWVLPNGKYEYIGNIHNTQGYADSWHGGWEIRNKTNRWGYDKYEIYPERFYPYSKFKDEYLKYGINANMRNISFQKAIQDVPHNPRMETLLKTGLYSLLHRMSDVARYWSSVKICIRNGYTPSDGGIWLDYIALLDRCQRDLHNAKFVCPKNLKAEHDRYVEKDAERLRKEDLQKKRALIEREQPKYEKRMRKFFGLQFEDGNITVQVLQSVMEFYEEGRQLRHCVFSGDYYKKSDSLILSARINGLPVETIEVNLSKMEISQARGLQNTPSAHNKKIVALVQKNLTVIRNIARKKTA